jgi:phosphomannomutase
MKNIVLFDMDGTLTPARKEMPQEMLDALLVLLQYADIGIVSGSPFEYIKEQCSILFEESDETILRDLLILPCNGTQKYLYTNNKWNKDSSLDMRQCIGEDTYEILMTTLVEKQYLCSLLSKSYGYPMTGHHISYRGSMVNWSPVGRNANHKDRERFAIADQKHSIRRDALNKILAIPELTRSLSFSLGGSTSIDIYPHGWDKTYALNHYDDNNLFWFVGDRCLQETGNDKPLYDKLNSIRKNTAFQTNGPNQTIQIIKDIITVIEAENDK